MSIKDENNNLVDKLPFIMGASAAVLAGVASYGQYGGTWETYIRMGAAMALFYILGIYVKSTFNKIFEEMKKKEKEEKEKLEIERIKSEQQKSENNHAGSKIDITVDGNEEFEPLSGNEAIRDSILNK